MLRLAVCLASTVLFVVAPPAVAHHGGGARTFPTLKASAGRSLRARVVERRVRHFETRLLGREHAVEHARWRKVRRTLERETSDRTLERSDQLQPDNALVSPATGGFWAPGIDLPVVAINATLMHTGKVLIFAYPWRPGRP